MDFRVQGEVTGVEAATMRRALRKGTPARQFLLTTPNSPSDLDCLAV